MTGVIVSHPHAAAVASDVAAALQSKGILSAYFTGVAAVPSTWRGRVIQRFGRHRRELHNRLVAGVDADALRSCWSVELLSRSFAMLLRRRPYDAMYVAHDTVVAAVPWPRAAEAVYAYEDAALNTFRAARRRGLTRIWDLPLPHWVTLERLWTTETARWPGAMGGAAPVEPGWKKARKDEELRLADVVCAASTFTRESLEAADIRTPIIEIPYAFPIDRFRCRERAPQGPFTVLAVGTHDLRKGTPYLLEAWRRLQLRNARLRLIGPIRLSREFLQPYAGLFEHVPHVPRALLEHEYATADLLAFPTLGDGFGLVIQEAMSCGTPVLTTRCGGGPECITDDVDGWIVPERDIEAIAQRIEWAASHRDEMYSMGRVARARAERWPAPKYREALATALSPYVPGEDRKRAIAADRGQ